MTDIGLVAEAADMIVDGYAFTVRDDGIAVLNLNHPDTNHDHPHSGWFINAA